MKTGDSTRTYTKNKTEYVVEGFSKKSNCFVYPSETWSWTNWSPTCQTTYKTLGDAIRAISGGYLKDMITTQEVVDIRIFEVTVVTECHEKRRVTAYDVSGTPVEHSTPIFTTEVGEISHGDYLILDNKALALVESVTAEKMHLDIVNGCYTMVLDLTTTPPSIHPDSKNLPIGAPVIISHIGLPDPNTSSGWYNEQIEFYRENFPQDVMTSTKLTA